VPPGIDSGDAFWTNFGAIWEGFRYDFWNHFGPIWDGFWYLFHTKRGINDLIFGVTVQGMVRPQKELNVQNLFIFIRLTFSRETREAIC